MNRIFLFTLWLMLVVAWSPSMAAGRSHVPASPTTTARSLTTPNSKMDQKTNQKLQRFQKRMAKKMAKNPDRFSLSRNRTWALILGGLALIGGFVSILVLLFLSAILGFLGLAFAGLLAIGAVVLYFI